MVTGETIEIETREDAEARRRTQAMRSRNMALLLACAIFAIILGVIGAGFVIKDSGSPAPTLPAAVTPPHAHQLGADQTTPELGSNQITTTALYRVPSTPASVIAYYRRALPGHGGTIGRFTNIVRVANVGFLPVAVERLPTDFIDDKDHTGAHVHYTFTEYNTGGAKGSDIGILVDLRHPKGPTLVYVEMLSS